MSKGIDGLLHFLVQQIALQSRLGATTDYVLQAVSQFYAADSDASALATKTSVQLAEDRTYFEQVWTWLIQHPDISLRRQQGPELDSLSLSEVEALNARADKRPASKADHSKSSNVDGSTPSHLRLFASEDQIWRSLTGHGVDQKKVSALEFTLLTTIASFREEGVTQPDLPRLTGQDKRSIPGRTSRLADKGYIIKKTIHTPGKITSRLILKQFAAGVESDRDLLSGPVDRESWSWQKFGKWLSILIHALKTVKDAGAGGIAWRELRDELSISRDRSRGSKAIIDAMQRFRYLGCVAITRTVSAVPTEIEEGVTRIKDVKYLRDVTNDDWAQFWLLEKDLTIRNARRKSLSMIPGDESQDNGLPDEEAINPRLESASDDNVADSKASTNITPIWTPDRPLVNLTFSVVDRAGTTGIGTAQATAQISGKFFNRPLSTLLVDISNSLWDQRLYASQHLQLMRDATQIERYTAFKFYSFANLQKLVDDGEKAWQWIGRSEPKPGAADPFEFSDLSSTHFIDSNASATLEECLVVALSSGRIREDDPKRVTGQAEPLEPGSSTKIRKTRAAIADRPRKFKSSYTPEELAKMRPNERRAAMNTVMNGRRYHYKQVEARIMVRIKAGDDIERAGEVVKMDVIARMPKGDNTAKQVQLDVLPEILAKLRRETFPPSVAAHMIVYPGPRLKKLTPAVPKGRPPKPKPGANKAQGRPKKTPKAAMTPKAPSLPHSKPINLVIGYVASSSAHSKPIQERSNSLVSTHPAAPIIKGRTAKSAIKAFYGRNNYLPSVSAHSDLSYSLSHNVAPDKRERKTKKDQLSTESSQLENMVTAAMPDGTEDEDLLPAPPSQPSISRSGRAIKQPSKILREMTTSLSTGTSLYASPELGGPVAGKKKSVGALTYEDQYKWLSPDTTPGVYIGPQCSLKKAIKGRGPRSLLVVFRSPQLQDHTVLADQRSPSFATGLLETAQKQLGDRALLPPDTSPIGSQVNGGRITEVSVLSKMQHNSKRKRNVDDGDTVLTKKLKTIPVPEVTRSTDLDASTGVEMQTGDSSNEILSGQHTTHEESTGTSAGNDQMAVEARQSSKDRILQNQLTSYALATNSEKASLQPTQCSDQEGPVTGESSMLPSKTAEVEIIGAQRPVANGLEQVPASAEEDLVVANEVDLTPPVRGSYADERLGSKTDANMIEADQVDSMPPSQNTQTPDSGDVRPLLLNRQSANLTSAASSRLTAYSKPVPRKRPQPPPTAGVSRHGGSLMAERKNFVLGILRQNGGFFSVGHELWYPFASQWIKKYGPVRPDTRTVQNIVKQLVNETKIKEHIFNFKDKGGALRHKKIIMLPAVSKDDPRITALKEKIIEHYPHVYVPPGIEYDQALRRDPKIGSGSVSIPKRSEPLTAVERQRFLAQRRIQQAADKLADQQRQEFPEADEELGTAMFQLQGYQHDVPQMDKKRAQHSGQYDLAMQPSKQRNILKHMIDAENLDPNGPIYLPLPDYRSAGQTTRRQREGAIETINLLGEATRSGMDVSYDRNWTPRHELESAPRAAPRLGRRPPKAVKQLEPRPRGFKYITDERCRSAAPEKHLAVERIDLKQDYFKASGTFGTFLEIPGWFAPKSVDDIFNHAWPGKPVDRTGASKSRDTNFSHVVDRILQWERTDRGSANMNSNGWINITLDSQMTKSQRNNLLPKVPVSKKPRRAAGANPAVRQPRAIEKILTLKRPAGKTDSEHPDAPIVKRQKLRGTRHRPQDPVLDKRILLAIIMTKILYRAGDPRFIDWSIVRRMLNNEYSVNLIRKRYNMLRTPWKAWVAQAKKDLEERFLKAYEAGDIPPIYYDNIEQTQWSKLLAWVERQSLAEQDGGLKKKSVESDPDMEFDHDLTSSRHVLEKVFSIKDYPVTCNVDAFEVKYKGCRAADRREWQHDDAHILPARLSRRERSFVSTATVARSWVRATALTGQNRYNGFKARQKLETLPLGYVTTAEQELFAHKALIMHTKDIRPGERPIDISQSFVANLKMSLGIHHHEEAVEFKQRLDMTFREQGVLDFQQSADDGHMIAMLNMYAQGMISFQARDIKSTPMGHLKGSYKSRSIDKNMLQFQVEIRPTARYVEGLAVTPRPPDATGPRQTTAQGIDVSPLPLWVDIHGNHENLTWQSALNVMFTLCLVRPGLTAAEMSNYVYPTLEAWELEVLMQWSVDAGLAQWVGKKRSGVKLAPTWWSWMGSKMDGG